MIPAVFVADVLWLGATLTLRARAPRAWRRALGLLAVYITLETFGHGVAEQGAALVMGWLL